VKEDSVFQQIIIQFNYHQYVDSACISLCEANECGHTGIKTTTITIHCHKGLHCRKNSVI